MRRTIASGAALWVALTAGRAAADDLSSARAQGVTEVSHTVSVSIDRGVAKYVVRRTFENPGTRADQASLRIELPHGAASTGLRIRARERWYDGELMEAEQARAKYRELTGMGTFEPKDPALLEWVWADVARLWVFPVLPGAVNTVEYTLTAPLEYRDGHYVVSYPQPVADEDGPTLARPVLTVEPGYGDARTGVRVAGRRVAPGAAVVLDPPTAPPWIGDGEPDAGVGYVHSSLVVERDEPVTEATVALDIDHTYASDLRVELVGPDGWSVPVIRGADDGNDIRGEFEVTLPATVRSAGTWTLRVSDHAGLDVGTLDAWSIELRGAAESDRPVRQAALGLPAFIPDASEGDGLSGHAVIELEPPPIRRVAARLGRVVASKSHGFARFEIDAAPELSEIPEGASVVFVVDVSRSQDDAEVDEQLRVAQAYAVHVPDARIQLVAFDRRARRVLSDFVAAPDLADAIEAARAAGQFSPGNGSALELGLEVAADALAGRRGPTRIVALTDAALRTRFENAMADRSLASAPRRTVTHVVVPDPYRDRHLERDDGHALSPIAAHHHGVLYRVSLPADDKQVHHVATVLPLVRPVSIDHFAIEGLDLSGARDVPESLAEGVGYRAMLQTPDPPERVVVTGKLWAEDFRRVVRHEGHFDRATAAFVFSEDEYHDLSTEEQLKVAFMGGAVSPVTSYLAVEPGVRPSTEGFDEGTLGLGNTGLVGHGGGAGSGSLAHVPDLADALAPAIERCEAKLSPPAGWEVDLDVETTWIEIVDVQATRTTDPKLADCIVEGVWATALPAGAWPERKLHTLELR